jgi:hypothetical protein
MGRIVHDADDDPEAAVSRALGHILAQDFSGGVLAGTKSVDHLRTTVAAFKDQSDRGAPDGSGNLAPSP